MEADQSQSPAGARSAPLLSSLIQTRSVELVLAPIASQVSQLMILTKSCGRTPFPGLDSSALSVMDAVQHMVDVGNTITAETPDEGLQADLPVACSLALRAGEQLVEATRRLAREQSSRAAQVSLNTAAQGILEGTMKVLLVWDEAEVRKIISAAHWTLDRLGLVKVAKSMRSLVICFGGLSEAMALLLSLADKRQKDLTDYKRKEGVLSALSRLKLSLPPFCEVMKKYVRDPTDVATQNLRNVKANQVSTAVHDLIKAVSPLDEAELLAAEPDNMITNIMEVHRKLAPDSRYFIGPDLDRHLDAILQNSMAVAHVSRERYSETILQLCSEVLALRKKLGENLAVVTEHPNSLEARAEFDATAEALCEKLCEIDRWVADAVVDQITEVFVEPSAPVNHLVRAAARSPTTSPGSSPEISLSSSPTHTASDDPESDARLTRQVELFRRHSRRLSQVASHAAQSSADSKRVQAITELARQVDEATPKVVEAAVALKRAPPEDLMVAKETLDSARREWAEKVQLLTAATDDIVDPEDFLAVSEANIHQDMTKCRDAVRAQSWPQLRTLVQGVAAKARRVVDIGKMAAEQVTETWKKEAISVAGTRLENAIPRMVTLVDEVISDPTEEGAQESFAQSLKAVLDSIHSLQAALTADSPRDYQPQSMATSTPMTGPAHGGLQESPFVSPVPPPSPPPPPSLPPRTRYIGSLKRKKKNRASVAQEDDTPDIGATPVRMGDAQTQTPSASGRSMQHDQTQTPLFSDHSMQHQIHYPSAVVGTSATLRLSPTTAASPPGDTSPEASVDSNRRAGRGREEREELPAQRTVQRYARPLQELVTVAQEGEVEGLQSHANALQARAIRLASIAETAAESVRHNPKLMKVLKIKAREVSKLTPQVIGHAEEVARDPLRSRQPLEDLQLSSHQWAGHVSQLIEATQKANYPWSKTAERLVSAAKTGEGLEAQKKHVSTQTSRMVDVAMVTVVAAETEEAIGVGSGSGDDSERWSHDPELTEQIRHVRVTASEIEKLTPQLLSAADMACGRGDTSATTEHLNLLSQEWATKAKVLMRGVDDVSLGMSGPADTLLLSARSGDPTLLSEQGRAITELASSLGNIAQDALEGCEDRERTEKVRRASQRISAASVELISCANRVAEEGGGVEEEDNPCLLDNLHETLESTELLRRDWASQVHLLTAHIDRLTAKVSAPLDRLVETALQASRTSSKAKRHLLDKFEKRTDFIRNQLEVVEASFDETTAAVERRDTAMDGAALSISFLRKLTPHAVGACRSLTSEPGSAMLEHFNHLRRQWASKAQKLLQCLKKITTVDMEPVLVAFAELIQMPKSGRSTPGLSGGGSGALHKSYSFEDITEEEETGKLVVRDPAKLPDPHKRYSAAEEAMEMSRHVIQVSKRPTSMAVPLPSWSQDLDRGLTASSKSIAVAAQSLREVADEFHEEGNIIIKVAKKMSQQMSQMAEFSHGRGELQSKVEMINTAKAIAANGKVMVQFAYLISEQCTDERMKANLQYCAEVIPTLSTQLRILASVKDSTPADSSADVMLVKNAENLMQAVIKTMKAAEAACIKGLKAPEDDKQKAVFDMIINWKHKLYHQRTLETIRAPRGARGLRKLNRSHISTPSLVDVLQPKVVV